MFNKLPFSLRRTIYTGSIGKVLASYAPVDVSMRPAIFSKKGLNERFFRAKTFIRNLLSGFFIQKSLNDFSRKNFIKEVTTTYAKFLESFYKADMSSIRSISTPNLFSELNSKVLKIGTKVRTPSHIRITKTPTIVQILPVKMQIPQTVEIYQITVKFEYEIENQAITDFVVFERSAASSDSAWRICGKLLPSSNYY